MENIRPTSLEDFVGQERVRNVLHILCKSAKAKGTSVSSVLLVAAPGLGKTTLGRIIAHQMGSRMVETVGGNIQYPDRLVDLLRSLKPLDVFFIDEIHALPRNVEEILYGAMEDGQVPVIKTESSDFMKSLGVSTKPVVEMLKLPPFTLVGASTISGLVSAPLRSRFSQILNLEPYSIDDLICIVLKVGTSLGHELSTDVALEVARRSRATARIAIGNLKWLVEYSSGMGLQPDLQAAKDAFKMQDIDENGLTGQDRKYLQMLLDADQAVGLCAVSMAINETEETIEQTMEPYLIREGLIRRAPRGRVVTDKARLMFSIPSAGK